MIFQKYRKWHSEVYENELFYDMSLSQFSNLRKISMSYDIENRHHVIFDPDYRSETPGSPSFLPCKQGQKWKQCFHIGITAVSKISNFQHLFSWEWIIVQWIIFISKPKSTWLVKINVYIINENDSLKLQHHLARGYLPYPRETRTQSNKVTD